MVVTPTDTVRIGGKAWTLRLHRSVDANWNACERELEQAGVALPVSHRGAWARATGQDRWLLGAHDAGGACRAAAGISVRRTRALPGHRVVRADKVGLAGPDRDAWRALVVGLKNVAEREPRVLRLDLALFSRSDDERAALREQLTVEKFRPATQTESYEWTSLIDLGPSEDELLATFHKTARRHIRAIDKRPVELRAIRDRSLVDEMVALVVETRQRTGGPAPRRPMEGMLEMARRHPAALRVVGLFAREGGALLAFASAHREGDLVRYADAASTRCSPIKLPLGYAPLWDLMRWAKQNGARQFDLGGITDGTHTDDDPLGGISDFKRYFRGAVTCVGEEWTFTSRPTLDPMVRWAQRAAAWSRDALVSTATHGRAGLPWTTRAVAQSERKR